MNWEIIHKLLDKLDSAVNSNSFWIELGVPSGAFELDQVLVQHLRAGNFHFELVKQDINRGWYHYSEMVLPKHSEQPVFIQRPGNIWNGTEEIKFEEVSKITLIDHLIDLLTGKTKYYSKSSLGTPLNDEEANALVSELLEMLSAADQNWRAFLITPDFLNQVADDYDSGYIQIGYFENCGRDMAMAFLVDEHLYILLTNGYS